MFEKSIVTHKGTITNFHGIFEIKAKFPQDTSLSALVYSYASEGDYLIGIQPVKKTETFIPFSAINSNNLVKDLEQWLIANTDVNNIFYGGNYKGYSSDPLVYAQDKQWAIIKSIRGEKINAVDYDASTATVKDAVAAIKDKAGALKTLIYASIDTNYISSITWDTPTN